MNRTVSMIVGATAPLLVACGGGSEESQTRAVSAAPQASTPSSPAATATQATSSPAVSATPTLTAEPTVTRFALGESGGDEVMRVTAYAVKTKGVAKYAPAPEDPTLKWASADVRVCLRPGEVEPLSADDRSWSLVGTDNASRYAPAAVISPGFPAPQFPVMGELIAPGECVRGHIMFEIPKTAKIGSLRYSAPTGAMVTWKVR